MLNGSDQDAILWLQFKEGSRDAFAAIYQLHGESLIAYGLRLCPDRDLLKDQVQELFVELWQSRKNLSPTDNIKFYLFKALRFKLIRAGKRRRPAVIFSQKPDHFEGPSPDGPVEESIIERESQESRRLLLKRSLARLTPRQQEAIQLRFYQGFTQAQVAALMEMNYQSVSNLIYQGLCRLKELMTPAAISLLLLFFC